jgi:probable rRNA maturation factor
MTETEPPDDRLVDVVDEQETPIDTARLRAVAARALDALAVPRDAHLTVTLVDPARIADMKRDAFGVHRATDVLSFAIDSLDDPSPGPVVLGDVVICPAVALRQARALGRTLDDEMNQLLVHGILHILGSDHADTASERAMFRAERALLAEARA